MPIMSLATNAVLRSAPVSFAFVRHKLELMVPRAQSLPNVTSDELLIPSSVVMVCESAWVVVQLNGIVLPVPRGSKPIRSNCPPVRLEKIVN